MRGGSGRGSLRSGCCSRCEPPGPGGVVVDGEDACALGENALGEDVSADAWEGAADPLVVATPACPGDVTPGPPLLVPGVSEPPNEGKAELITGAAVRRARTPFGSADQRKIDEAVLAATRLSPAATATGTGMRLRGSGLGAAVATVGWPPRLGSTSIVGSTSAGVVAVGVCEPALIARLAQSMVSKASVRGGKYTGGPSKERRQIGHSGIALLYPTRRTSRGLAARRNPVVVRLQWSSEVRYHCGRGWRGSAPASLVLCENTLDRRSDTDAERCRLLTNS